MKYSSFQRIAESEKPENEIKPVREERAGEKLKNKKSPGEIMLPAEPAHRKDRHEHAVHCRKNQHHQVGQEMRPRSRSVGIGFLANKKADHDRNQENQVRHQRNINKPLGRKCRVSFF